MKLWSGRFKKETNELVEVYNASIQFDYQLARFDIEGSLAHVEMLGHCGILDNESVTLITKGLCEIGEKITNHAIEFRIEDEDIHMNIERRLHELIGDVAGKLHTGRSRNDQVALDMHLYLRYHTVHLITNLADLMQVLITLATDHVDTFMPGYTHLQRAEPIRFSHYLLAYFFMLRRDAERLMENFSRLNYCPLGAGALAGSGFPIDRDYVARKLKFDGIYQNSLDAVSDRDFMVEFLSTASLIMMHLSKMSEEIILWSSQEFNFIELDDEFCTGSSMMPQKKNPDVAELVRGKTGRVYGALMGLLTVLKGLPLAYNKDMQEDKEGVFDCVKTLRQTLPLYTAMLKTMKVNQEVLHHAVENDYANATQLANYLVAKGVPFRQAHAITGKIVCYAIEHQKLLGDLPLTIYQTFHSAIDKTLYPQLTVESVIEAHVVVGGTAKASVMQQLACANQAHAAVREWLETTGGGAVVDTL